MITLDKIIDFTIPKFHKLLNNDEFFFHDICEPINFTNIYLEKANLKGGESGFLFESENVEELAFSIEHIYLNRNQLLSLKLNAQNFVEENFSNFVTGEKHFMLYKSLLSDE